MPIHLEPPAYNPSGPDGRGWNRLSLNAHMGTQRAQCALRPRTPQQLFESWDTRRARWGGWRACIRDGNCTDGCPVFASLHDPKLLVLHGTDRVLFRLREIPSPGIHGQAEFEPHLMNHPDRGWASTSERWTWNQLMRLRGWRFERVYRDAESEGFWLRKVDPTSDSGIPGWRPPLRKCCDGHESPNQVSCTPTRPIPPDAWERALKAAEAAASATAAGQPTHDAVGGN